MSTLPWFLYFISLVNCVHCERYSQICKSVERQLFSCHINTTFEALSTIPFDALYIKVRIEEKFHTLQEKPFEKFMLLQILTIAKSGLEMLSNTAFDGLFNLEILTVQGRIHTIEENTFKPCHSLRRLDLGNNEISQLSDLAIAVQPLMKLETLILRHNPIESITDTALSPLNESSITNLDLSNCHIIHVGFGALSSLTHLTRLLMSYNPITHYDIENALQNISSGLRVLKLNYLNLTHFPLNSAWCLSELQELCLTHHGFKFIENESIPSMPNLLRLNLSYGELVKIDGTVFLNLPHIQSLDLSHNNLLDIPFDESVVLEHLMYIDLSHNQIGLKPDPLNFSSITPNLMFLQLSFNNITYNPIQYQKLKKLETLHLDNNFLIPWHRSLISDNDFSLMALYVNNNRLTTVTPAMLADFGVLRHLSLQDNPYACVTCEVYEFAKWLNMTSTNLMDFHKIICKKPENMRVILMKEPFYCNLTNFKRIV